MQHVCQASSDATTRKCLQRPSWEVKNKIQHGKPYITESVLDPLTWSRRRKKKPEEQTHVPLLRIPTDGPSLPPTGIRLPSLPLLAGAPASLLVALLALLPLVALLALVAYRIGLRLLAAAKAALLAALLSLLSLAALLALVAYRVPEPAEPAEDMRASLLWYSIYGAALKIAPSSAGPAQVLRLLVAYPHGCCRGCRGCWPG